MLFAHSWLGDFWDGSWLYLLAERACEELCHSLDTLCSFLLRQLALAVVDPSLVPVQQLLINLLGMIYNQADSGQRRRIPTLILGAHPIQRLCRAETASEPTIAGRSATPYRCFFILNLFIRVVAGSPGQPVSKRCGRYTIGHDNILGITNREPERV